MSDAVATVLDTEAGLLSFRHYFVELRRQPVVRSIAFEGAGAPPPIAHATTHALMKDIDDRVRVAVAALADRISSQGQA